MKRLYNFIPIKKSLAKNDQKKLIEEAHVSFVIFGVKTVFISKNVYNATILEHRNNPLITPFMLKKLPFRSRVYVSE